MRISRRESVRLALSIPAFGLASCGSKKSPRYQGYALIANHDSAAVAVIDLSRFQRLEPVPIGFAPSAVLAAPARSRAFVLGRDSETAGVLDLDSLKIAGRLRLHGKPTEARMAPDAESFWVLMREPDALVQIRVADGVQMTRCTLPGTGTDFDLQLNQIAIAFPDSHSVARYSMETKKLQISSKLDVAPKLIRLRSDGKVLFTGNGVDRSISVFATDSLNPIVTLPLAVAPRYLCMNSDGGQLFCTGDGMDGVAIVDTFDTEVNATLLAGHSPGAMAVTTGGPQYLFVSNPTTDDLTIINIDDRRVLAQVAVGEQPGQILVTPDNEYALVLNQESGDVAVIRLMNIRQANLISRRSRTAPLFTLIAVGSDPVSGVIAPKLS